MNIFSFVSLTLEKEKEPVTGGIGLVTREDSLAWGVVTRSVLSPSGKVCG